MTTDHEHSNPAGLTRRQVLKVAGVTLGAMSAGRQAWAQAPKPGGSFVSAQTTEATGLDPQLVPALSRSRRSPMMYSQLVRFDGDKSSAFSIAAMASLKEGSRVPFSGIGITFALYRHSLGWIGMYYVVLWDSVASI